MAKIFRICAEYERQTHCGWSKWLRGFTKRPNWKRVSKYDNVLDRVGRTSFEKHSFQSGRRPAGVYKRTIASPSRRPTSPSNRPSSIPRNSSSNRRSNSSMDALVKILLSGGVLDELSFVLRARERTNARRIQADVLSREISGLKQHFCNLWASLKQEADQNGLSPSSATFLRQLEHSNHLHDRAIYLEKEGWEPLKNQIVHESRVVHLAYDHLMESVKPAIERAGLLRSTLDEHDITSRLEAPLPYNDIYPPEENENEDEHSHSGNDVGIGERAVELPTEDEDQKVLRLARQRAFLDYEQADSNFISHRENYAEQLRNHLNGISPGWPGWSASWSKSDFDAAHLQQAMLYSTALREAEDALFQAIENAQAVGVAPMHTFQIFGFPDHPGDDPAESVNDAPTSRIDAWRETLPRSPPNPEPWGPGVVRYPSEQMSELEGDVEAWETWSHREEDMQKKRLLEKYRGPRPLGWTLPAGHGGANGGDGGRLMNSHLI